MIQKGKSLSLFQSKLHSITISSIIDYILEVYSTSSSLKKKKTSGRKRKGKRGGKEEKKKKGMERVCAKEGETDVEEKKKGRKRERENEGEGERDERRGRERRTKIEKAAQEMYRPPRTHSLARS